MLIAPFLGDEKTIRVIEKAASLAEWRHGLEGRVSLEPVEEIWRWIAAQYDQEENILPCTVLAYGSNDRLSDAAKLLARYLPDSDVFKSDGGHNRTSWHRLWVDMLSGKRLPGPDCSRTRVAMTLEIGE